MIIVLKKGRLKNNLLSFSKSKMRSISVSQDPKLKMTKLTTMKSFPVSSRKSLSKKKNFPLRKRKMTYQAKSYQSSRSKFLPILNSMKVPVNSLRIPSTNKSMTFYSIRTKYFSPTSTFKTIKSSSTGFYKHTQAKSHSLMISLLIGHPLPLHYLSEK